VAEAVEQLLRDGAAVAELSDGLVLGRAPECGVRLDEPSVSRRHAVVHGEPGRWSVEDCGSRNGTRVGPDRLVYGSRHPLRDHDVLTLGSLELTVRSAAGVEDGDRTSTIEAEIAHMTLGLSAFQHQVVRALAEPWLAGGEPASNAQIATALGTPLAVDAIKAALRRVYARTGLTDAAAHAKRTELCRVAQRSHWL
jgi:hypothetical protein